VDRATRFLDDETLAGRSLEPWLHDHDALIAAIQSGSRSFADGLEPSGSAFALLRADRLAVTVTDRRGEPLFANAAWREAFDRPDADILAEVLAIEGRRTVRVGAPADEAPRSTLVYAAAALARDWSLPDEAVAALHRPEAAAAVVGVGVLSTAQVLSGACAAFGLTDLQTRVAIGLVRTGDVRRAAAEAGVTYQTARKVVAEAMRRVGVGRVAGLIERLVRLSFGVWPQGEAGAAELTDVWGLSARQASLALRIAEGFSRAEAAAAAGLSEATAKKELELVFEALDVRSAAGLARAVTEARALALITDATGDAALFEGDVLEPLALFHRPDGRQVAYSDYGPRSGRPVLVLHSSSASRSVPSRLVAALQARGFRPISLDRPGFGLTDPLTERPRDPFEGALDDMLLLLERLGLPRIDVVARGGAQVAVALARAAPARLGRVVLVNPDPASADHGRRRGPVGAFQEAYLRHPDLIEGLVRLLITHLSPARSRRMMLKALEASPLDLATITDARNMADYQRGFRLFSTGRIGGYVAEQQAVAAWSTPPLAGAAHWRVLLGRHDFLHDPERTFTVWRAILPEARIDWVEDAARLMVMSHADLVAQTLAEAPDPA
jgi:pimeloyl-ACP methyl ester carboxylesterase/DNA-binding CsgD family transcriptional regulator